MAPPTMDKEDRKAFAIWIRLAWFITVSAGRYIRSRDTDFDRISADSVKVEAEANKQLSRLP